MATDGFRIGVDLTAHSQQLKGVMDALAEAAEAARTVSMPTDAYGILCQPFRMMLDPVEQKGIDAINDAVAAAEAASNEVNAAAKEYESREETSSMRFKELS
ncbi:ESX-1 secretion-associated protein [Actinophytocola xinjiangensis]|uniref:ESX-1 secretion-associated protein n=1 Tax=Actinophytocola xinjiangensis TaxID=485602 RepID=A0A7Z0WLE1_9PSEU|nr:type VII secretion target [Actinophytocola xinjiangensis]OLF10140.1 ESX-1 secretion-associated protein [Actinophytocola xinjiangensis]